MATFHRSFLLLLLLPIALAAVGDYLLYVTSIGISAAVFFAFALFVLLLRTGLPTLWRRRTAAILVALLCGLFVALAKEPRTLAVLLTLLLLIALAATIRGRAAHSIREWFHRLLLPLFEIPVRPLVDQITAGRWFVRHRRLLPPWIRSFILWSLALGAGLIFVILFILGNPVIAEYGHTAVQQTLQLLRTIPEWLTFGRAGLWMGIAILTYGILRLRRWQVKRTSPPIAITIVPTANHERALALRALVVFNVIFAVETIIDVVYLWGGAKLPQGITYAAFAQRAAYPLIAAALLAAGFVLMLFRNGGPGHASRSIRILVFIWLAQNALLVLSCLLRLHMYISVYSLTYWRVAAIIWSFLVLVGLALIVLKILRHRSNLWLMRANTITAGITLYLCAFVNFEMLIANFNVRHCYEVDRNGAPLDLAYLYDLGPATLPALQHVRDQLPPNKAEDADLIMLSLHSELRDSTATWRGWTYDRHRTLASLRHFSPKESLVNARP